jgi:hypothetical protein
VTAAADRRLDLHRLVGRRLLRHRHHLRRHGHRATTVTATFNITTYTLTVTKTGTGSGTVTSSPAGINCGADCNETVNSHGTSVTLTAATAAGGSNFAGWSGGGCSASAPAP